MTDPHGAPAPIGFRIVIAAALIYLAVRLGEAVVWLVDRLR
ncbi:MAG TPA: hypothetical protein VJA44_02780 [Acidimicrobiia bacterium]|nr:hypothetical protein [Acidimicrobiia bacterium]